MHLATYGGAEDLLDKLAFYLDREALREKIATAGRAEAMEKHTYTHRMERLLRDAASRLPTVVGSAHRGAPPSIAASPAAPDPFYFGHVRPEVMALVPESAGRSLISAAGPAGSARRSRRASSPRSSGSSSTSPLRHWRTPHRRGLHR